jgi:hypothetical protein
MPGIAAAVSLHTGERRSRGGRGLQQAPGPTDRGSGGSLAGWNGPLFGEGL